MICGKSVKLTSSKKDATRKPWLSRNRQREVPRGTFAK